jgi:tetratricopeptide (TPR) repeat protein
MSYQLIPNIILILCILGVIILILRRMPEVAEIERKKSLAQPESSLPDKGVRLIDPSKLKTKLSFWLSKLWHFSLEAKDIKHSAEVSYRIKKMFRKGPATTPPATTPSTSDIRPTQPVSVKEVEEPITEDILLAAIQEKPKDLLRYATLGQFYLDAKNFIDAEHVYGYLVKHEPSDANYYAKLAFCYLNLKDHEAAVEYYEKSLDFDPGHPNRYYNLGLAYKGLGKLDDAKDMFKKAHELEPKHSKYRAAAQG